ncbi:23S rRNA (uracil(747)-C(5))-methyltransferase RlmC [Pantoea sp. 1.19]|uniref:23S rRNA (uracil(747)-C(5))-methyltransferase RlmC n=1 Tax=Pantoea sp. 1.19 TaxID=1925589 RepID=UPI00094914E1|nr:23S rRNA (uracil(747)-C(5))-methyltransferase RlmC [Pantoea sp. 1.19]
MHCELYDAGRCRSCQWLPDPYPQQIANKTARLQQLLPQVGVEAWRPAVTSAEQGFRNKAKMVVSGSVERPLLGILQRDGSAIDLCDCPLYPAGFQPLFATLKPFIARAGLTPYNVARRRGELKFLLLTENSDGEVMLRFVLRSHAKLSALRAALPWLQAQLPQLRVITANIQPVPMAILEGEEEIFLSVEQTLAVRLNDVPLWLRPKSFFQTNPGVAAKLYATAREWVASLPVQHMWDLFCGVGGFGLHCATPEMHLTGIEISPDAIACATRSAQQMGLESVAFAALDSTRFAAGAAGVPDLVLVNPPRRGIGEALCDFLSEMAPRWLLYSSCNPQTLAADVARLSGYRIVRIQLFDMFPHTAHAEVLVLLVREAAAEDTPAVDA